MSSTLPFNEQFSVQCASLIPETVYVFDMENRKVVFINGDRYINTGYPVAEFLAYGERVIEELIHPEDQKAIAEHLTILAKAKDEEVIGAEFRFKIKAGNFIWIKTTNKILTRDEQGNAKFVITVARDISKEKEHEKHLETLTNTFRQAFKYSPMGMALADIEGKFMDLNLALCNITGYSKTELLQKKFHDITYPDDLAEDLMYVESLKKKEIENFKMEKRYIKKNGDVVWVLISVTLVCNVDKPSFFIAQITDIDTLKKLNIALESQNSSLAATQESLSNRVHQLEELNHIIAHNLRGPSQNLKMLSEMFFNREIEEEKKEEELPFSYPELSMLMFESSKSLCDSLDTLMEIARIGLNRNITYDKCNMEKTFLKVKSQLNGMIQAKKATITTNFKDKHIFCPEIYMQSIIYNLLSNALKYVSEERNPEIEITSWRDENNSYLSLKDNGIGIDLEKFGKKLFKLNQTFHQGFDSNGVGLFLTKAQIDSIGGKIHVESKVGEGTKFVVTLQS
jgi:PAS domain S-box-containing protein